MKAQRIAIWGNSGSGKSTLAERLSFELRLVVHHIDKIAWQSGWQYTDEATFLGLHQRWIDEQEWIIEGVGHTSGLRTRFNRADLIVFLDTPAEICRVRAQRRIENDRNEQDRFIADGCRYSEVIEKQWQVIDDFQRHLQSHIMSIVTQEFRSKKFLQLDGRRSIEELCAEVRSA